MDHFEPIFDGFLSVKKVHLLERGNEGGPGGPEELDDTDNPRWVPLEYIYI